MVTEFDIRNRNHVALKKDSSIHTVFGFKDKSICIGNTTLVWIDSQNSYEAVLITTLKGIPLTNLIVEKLGFVFSGAHYFHPKNPDWFIWNFSKNGESLWKINTLYQNIGNKNGEKHIEIHYVHELQNIFYDSNKVMLSFDNYDISQQ